MLIVQSSRTLREGLKWKSFLLPWAKRLERKARPRASGTRPSIAMNNEL
jgi:hypothetical protein